MPELRPGHLGEDPGFLRPVADRFERGERLPVELEGGRQVAATGCQPGEAAERQAGSFLVTDSLLDLERLGVPRLSGVEVARDGVEDAVEARSESLGPGEAEGSAPLDALRRSPEPGFRIDAEEPKALKERSDAELTIGCAFCRRCDTPRPTRRSPARSGRAWPMPVQP